jgi:dTMP kinase
MQSTIENKCVIGDMRQEKPEKSSQVQADSRKERSFFVLIRFFLLGMCTRAKGFLFIWLSSTISLFGDWFNYVATLDVIYESTDAALALSFYLTARMVPPFVVSPFVGSIADHFDRRKLMIFADICRSVIVLGLIFVTKDRFWLLYVLVVLQMSLGAVFDPCREALIPNYVPRDRLVIANTINVVTWSCMMFIGSGLGGLFLTWTGVMYNYVVDSISYICSMTFLFVLIFYTAKHPSTVYKDNENAESLYNRTHVTFTEESANFFRKIIDGLRYIFSDSYITALTLLKSSTVVALGPIDVCSIRLGETEFIINTPGFTIGLIAGLVGISIIFGPLISETFATKTLRQMHMAIIVAFLVQALAVFFLSWSPHVVVFIVALMIRGSAAAVVFVNSSALLQMTVHDRIRGRVFAFDNGCKTIVEVAGILITGVLLDKLQLTIRAVLFYFALIFAGMSCLWVTLYFSLANTKKISKRFKIFEDTQSQTPS